MTSSSLRLLGAFALETPCSPVPLRLGRKAQAVLAAAALGGAAGVSRARLIALLWPDHAEDEARGALRQCLHLLRRSLGGAVDLLNSDGERLVVCDRACEVDVVRFEALSASGDLAGMATAAALYRGDFLESLEAGTDFERWAATERERLRNIACGVLARLGESVLDQPDRERAVQLAHRLLANDPVHEGCWRALMQLYVKAGLRAKALQAWNDCREALRGELGVEPAAETAALFHRLSGWPESPLAAPPAAQEISRTGVPRIPVVSGPRAGDHPRVVDLNLRGWEAFCRCTPQDNLLARAAFEEAVRLAGDHAEIIARVGWTHWMESVFGWTVEPERSMDLAEQWASRAIACNRTGRSTPHTLMGKVLLRRRRFDEGLAQLRVAVELEPQYAWAHFHLAEGLLLAGEFDTALDAVDRAIALDLNDHGMFLTIRGLALRMTNELEAAQAVMESAVTRNPDYFWAHAALAGIHAERGQFERARAEAATARRLNARFSVSSHAAALPMRHPEHQQRMARALQAAGVPADSPAPELRGA
ncbi:hypothetical protein RAMLITH_12905 [Ramlibacter sp. RBP-2]|uniref:Bacterial transcriptional activator domain-containing protein n=1 Tax=Ramlibacter lithotrophicus TaxID=2606681 RepID=A0A7X6I6W2_9BURK|nr:BTAD domain-containing putative transcriptional regulator [Ramlibacter lithotrophicus]NKE66726.1 hypothetical protein [Ramlibacter lithotrophicus]